MRGDEQLVTTCSVRVVLQPQRLGLQAMNDELLAPPERYYYCKRVLTHLTVDSKENWDGKNENRPV